MFDFSNLFNLQLDQEDGLWIPVIATLLVAIFRGLGASEDDSESSALGCIVGVAVVLGIIFLLVKFIRWSWGA